MNDVRKIIDSVLDKFNHDTRVVVVKIIDGEYVFEAHKRDVETTDNEVFRLYNDWQDSILINCDYTALITDHEFALLMSELWNIEMHRPIGDNDTEEFAYFIGDNENRWMNKEDLELIGVSYDDRIVDLLIDEIYNSGEYLKIIGKR